MISALGAAIITEVFPSTERGRALGIIGSVVSLGIALGPTVGGLLLDWSGWRTIFWVNLPVGIFASLVVARSLPSVSEPPARQPFDWWGALLLTAVLVMFSLGMTEGQERGFDQVLSWGFLGATVLGLVGFLWWEMRTEHPLLDLSLFRNGRFSLSLLTAVLVFVVIAGTIFILPFYLELVLGYRPRHVGLLLAVSPVLAGCVAPLAGYLSDRLGSRLISLAGLACMTLGCLLISTFSADLTDLGYILRVAPFGIGLGLFQSPNNSAIMGSVPTNRLGIASGVAVPIPHSGADHRAIANGNGVRPGDPGLCSQCDRSDPGIGIGHCAWGAVDLSPGGRGTDCSCGSAGEGVADGVAILDFEFSIVDWQQP
jgi:MFS family permease